MEHRTDVVSPEQSERAAGSPPRIARSATFDRQPPRVLELGSLLVLAVVCALPLLAERGPVEFISPHRSAPIAWLVKMLVVAGASLTIVSAASSSRFPDSWKVPCLLVGLAAFMTAHHWFRIDCNETNAQWQRELYLDILNHWPEGDGKLRVPHQFRLLPYGFVRGLEYFTGDFWFGCVAYRWFFSYWFLWYSYRFARFFLPSGRAVLAVLPVVVLYPLSVEHYAGQLTDPLSHALFALALVYIVEDRWIALAVALALGVLAKETAVLLVPAYLACTWRRGIPALAKAAALGAACMAAYFAARLPFGWSLGYGSINGTEGLMIGDNLGIGEPRYVGAVPVFISYLHLLLFAGIFLPFIVWHWQRIDGQLRALYVVLTPLVVFANLCFGWMYESRNYVSLLPLQAIMMLRGAARRSESNEASINGGERGR